MTPQRMEGGPAAGSRALGRARAGVAVAFLANGFVFGSWASRIPAVRAGLGLDDAQLGVALLSIAVGAFLSMPLSGGLISRFGSRRVTFAGASAMCAGLALAALAPSLPLLMLVLLFMGAGNGAMDVAMNTHGIAVEVHAGRPILSSFHAGWSVGGIGGAVSGGLAAGLGVPVAQQFTVVAIVLAVAAALAYRAMLPDAMDKVAAVPWFQVPPLAVIGIGIVGFCAYFAEGSVADWSAVLMSGSFGADAATAAFGYAAFSGFMTLGRFAGDGLVTRFGPLLVTRAGATLAICGMAMVLIVGLPLVGLLGFAIAGAGLAGIVPIVFRAGGRTPGVAAGTGVAAVTTLSYLGGLSGPPMIGFTAGQVGLRAALWIVVGVLVVTWLLASRTHVAVELVGGSPAQDAASA